MTCLVPTSFETDRLKLRMFSQNDFNGYFGLYSDAEAMQFMGDGKPLTRMEAWRHLAAALGHWQLRGYGAWAVEEKASGCLVGRVGLFFPEDWPGLEVGWLLGRPFWGRGFATEAARAVVRLGFASIGVDRIISLIHPQNVRSIRVATALGAVQDGTTELFGKSVLVYAHRAGGN